MTIASIDPAKIPASTDALVAGTLAKFERRLSQLEATAGRIGADSLRGDLHISNNSITSPQIVAGSITADRLNVSSLDAISATLGNIVAGNITLNAGSWIRTAPIGGSFAYTEFSPAGVRAQDAAGATTFNLSAATGILTAKMVIQTGTQMPLGFIGGGNLLPNSSCERPDLSVSPWSYFSTGGSGSVLRDTAQAWHGLSSFKVTNGAVAGRSGINNDAVGSRAKANPSTIYTTSAYVYPTVAGRTCLIESVYSNSGGAYISQDLATSAALPANQWSRITATQTSPANTAAIATYISCSGLAAGESVYFDGLQLEAAEVVTAYAPRPDEVLPGSITVNELAANSVSATQIQTDAITAAKVAAGAITAAKISATIAGGNLLSSATTGFEQDVSGWASSGSGYNWFVNPAGTLVRDTAQAYYGSASMRIPIPGAANYEGACTAPIPGPWRAGQTYTASLYHRNDGGARSCYMMFGDESGTPDVADSGIVTSLATGWTRTIVKWSPLTDRANARVAFRHNGGAGLGLFNIFVDAVQVEHGDLPSAWRQYVSPVVIEGSRIVAADFRTNLSSTRLQIDDTVGVASYVGGVITSQLKPGAGGLDIQAHTAGGTSSPIERTIRWLNSTNQVGVIEARRDASQSALWIDAYRASASNYTYLGLTAHAGNTPSGSSYAALTVASESGVHSLYGSAGTQTFAIMDSNGYTSFLRHNTNRDHKINYGFTAASFGGTGTAEVTISHGLGRTPSLVLVSIRDGQSVYYNAIAVGSKSWGATTFVATAQLFSGTSVGAVNLCWVAIG